ncbi:sulfotransferase 1C2-like [Contarinia nasturtii]|uniref:sulfotransferase 1C2-like n=1 Tax=Contarinia nasturtii TaxID=265458 RepID=UPI0012D482C4|nr:sulfotransferase 1C2-like [Contarinia nasturtii]
MSQNLTQDSAFIFEEENTPIDRTPYYKFEPCFTIKSFKKWADEFRTFDVRKDDVWILSLPRTGSTWIENIVCQLQNGFDFSKKPLNLLPAEMWTVRPKIIYIARNPKAVAISNFHIYRNGMDWFSLGFSGSIEEFFDLFLEDRVLFAPIHSHVLAYWQLHRLNNFLFLNSEEQFGGIKKIAKFLESMYDEDELKRLTDYIY